MLTSYRRNVRRKNTNQGQLTEVISVVLAVLPLQSSALANYGSLPETDDVRKTGEPFEKAPFSTAQRIGSAPESVKSVFILIRGGMVLPDSTVSKTFPLDKNYKKKWYKGRTCTQGMQLLHSLGRSLFSRYRYHNFMKESIFVTYSKTKGIENNVNALKYGLQHYSLAALKFDNSLENTLDKSFLFKNPEKCNTYQTILKEVDNKEQENLEQYKEFFKSISASIGGKVDGSDEEKEWYITTDRQVYQLWQILELERSIYGSNYNPPEWLKENEETMKNVVKSYYKKILSRNELSSFLLSHLLSVVLYNNKARGRDFHIHITEDLPFMAFKNILLSEEVEFSDFGDAIILEFGEEQSAKAYTFSSFSAKDLTPSDNIKTTKDILQKVSEKLLWIPQYISGWNFRCNPKLFRSAVNTN